MAGAVVAFVVKRVGDFLVDEAIFLYRVSEGVEWVERELRRMQAFLQDADSKRKRDERVNNWVRDVREAAYQAEDLVESFVHDADTSWRSFAGPARWLVCFPCEVVTRHQFGEEIRLMKDKLKEISDSRATYGIENLGADGADRSYVDENVQERRRVALHTHDSDLVGMEDEKQNILRQLYDQGVKRRAIISIVGMGGLGKTTLAKKVYNTVEIKSRFDCFAWINVSQQYRVMELLQDMVKKFASIEREAMGKMSREELEEKLYKTLEGKKYLVVMDDVWDNNVWNIFNAHLPDSGNGSRVLITTRSIDVATAADPCTVPHELRFLNDDESWELFSKKVFPHQDVEAACPAELKELGKQIAKKCGGLPLALVVLGGMLSRKPKSAVLWGKLAETICWQHSEDGQLCMEILALSYNDLPHHLRWCFLYLGSFPEDFEIEVGKLARLWIAEGFVTFRYGEDETLEDSAQGYLEELIQRCLVQVVDRSSYGATEKCRIHDLLHDLSIKEAREIGFFECHRNADHAPSSSSVRRLSLHKGMDTYLSQGHSTPNLRTMLGFRFETPSMDLTVKGLKLLRVVDLEGAPVETLPEEIGDVIHLRYLGLRKVTRVRCLPKSIGKLRRLQILDAAETGITKVPSCVWRIKTLRHIYVPTAVVPQIAPGSLSDLHALDKPRAGSWIHSSLASLSNLQKLGVTGITESHNTALSSSLEKLPLLNTLELAGERIPSNALALSNLRHLRVLQLVGQLEKPLRPYSCNQLPSNLTQLTLSLTRLDQDPLALLEELPDLRILILLRTSYLGKDMVCTPSGFQRLQVLRVEYLEDLEHWEVGDGAMPCLRSLSIRGCRNLQMLPQGLPRILALQELTIANMSDDFYLRVRKGEGEDWHKIQHIPSIRINNRQVT